MKNIFLFLVMAVIGLFFFAKSGLVALPAVSSPPSVWQTVVVKLDKVPNTFSLHQTISLVPDAQAAANYDNAKSYIAIDETTGQILAEKDSATPLSIASLTKIMTAVVALDLLQSTDEITISQKAATVEPTTIGVVPGQQMSVEELLHGMLMTSANDAAQAVMDGVNAKYGQDIFIRAMNEKARFLGLTSTHFTNPQGFDDPAHKSSSRDLAILASYALSHYPIISAIVQKEYAQLPESTLHKQFDLYNWNGLLGVYPGVTGVKIGNTGDAGYTTIVSATRDSHTILAVLLGAPGIVERDMWTAALLDDAFESSFGLPPVHITQADLQQKYATWHYWN